GRFDSAEPQAFRLALRAAELARGIDVHADPVVGRLLQFDFIEFDEFVLHVVDGLGGEFHYEFVRASRTCHEYGRRRHRLKNQTRARFEANFSDNHVTVPPMNVGMVPALGHRFQWSPSLRRPTWLPCPVDRKYDLSDADRRARNSRANSALRIRNYRLN